MNFKNILAVVAISATTAITSVVGYSKWMESKMAGTQESGKLPVNYAGFYGNNNVPGNPVDFTAAATSATPAVVHIKTKTKARQTSNNQRQQSPYGDMFGGDMFEQFFNAPRTIPEQAASGSGVFVSADGYIVTNNHVVDGADEINVTLTNKRTYKATVIGTDPSSDLAVIKIDGDKFPYLIYGNSDELKLGQWVLAIGYPLNLDVTVSAGIVSAKARSININQRQSKTPVESFIQTDAAVNPGNSGGALINTNGELVGINSAIASATGSYTGYSFAIPVNLTRKVVADLVEFGEVQRAFIGVSIQDLDGKLAKEKSINEIKGVYVRGIVEGGSGSEAGIKEGDVITKVGDIEVNNKPELMEQISRYRPGNKINVTIKRNNQQKVIPVVLKNKNGNTDVVLKSKVEVISTLGASFEEPDKDEMKQLNIENGLRITKLSSGKLLSAGIKEGFIITSVDKKKISSIDDVRATLENKKGGVLIEGVYPNGMRAYYGFGM